MRFDPQKHHRRSVRLQGYDYTSPGWYFVTIFTKDRIEYFGSVEKDSVRLTEIGKNVEKTWNRIPHLYENAVLDAYIIMPNHIHGIIGLIDGVVYENSSTYPICKGVCKNAPENGDYYSRISPVKMSLPVIIRSYKSAVTGWCRRHKHEYFVWHRSFYDHIIRSDKQLSAIRQYIRNNPSNWAEDPDRKI